MEGDIVGRGGIFAATENSALKGRGGGRNNLFDEDPDAAPGIILLDFFYARLRYARWGGPHSPLIRCAYHWPHSGHTDDQEMDVRENSKYSK